MMTPLLVLCLVAVVASMPQQVPAKTRYDNYQVLSIIPNSQLGMRFVHGLSEDIELDMWKETPLVGDEAHLMVPPARLLEIKTKLTKRNIPFSVYIENVQEGLDVEEARLSKRAKAFSYDDYNPIEDIYDEIERLRENCPSAYTCDTYDIGTTVGGLPLTILHIRGSASGRSAIWIDSAIHAREWLAPATVFRFIQRIWNSDDGAGLLSKYDFYFLPVMNPDGYSYTWTNTRMWRKNRETNSGSTCVGTDLNRNYATNWDVSGTSSNPCSDTYSGSSAGSCAETQAVQTEIDRIGSGLTAFVSVHTYGNYWLHAWGHQQQGSCVIADDHADLYRVANAAADAASAVYNTFWLRGNSCATIYPASGLTLEYAKTPGGVKYTYTPELRGGSFAPPASEIDPSDMEFWAAINAQMEAIEAVEAGR